MGQAEISLRVDADGGGAAALAAPAVPANFQLRLHGVLFASRTSPPNLGRAAQSLCVSTRTLKRRLQRQGLSFRGLRDGWRLAESLRLLEDRALSVEAVAQQLGYSSAANFARAFRRWTGLTPGASRRVRAAATAS